MEKPRTRARRPAQLRVGASFFLGVVVFHLNARLTPRRVFAFGFWALTASMLMLFYYPSELSPGIHLVWLAVLSPRLILAGANTQLFGRLRTRARISGELSYLVYALDYPIFIRINGAYQTVTKHQNVVAEAPIIIFAVLLGSHAALKFFDEPTRRWVGQLLRQRQGVVPRRDFREAPCEWWAWNSLAEASADNPAN